MQPEVDDRGAVDTAEVQVTRRVARPVSLREMRALTVKRVMEEYERSGFVPPSLRDQLIADESALRWAEGRPMPREAVERHIDEWATSLLERKDKQHDRRRKDIA